MSAGKYNINVEQGTTYSVRFTYKDDTNNPVDLTDYTAQIQFRETKDATTTIYDSSTGGDITLGGVDGTIDLSINTATTTAFDFDNCVYDLELTLDNETIRLIEGRVYLSKEVTR